MEYPWYGLWTLASELQKLAEPFNDIIIVPVVFDIISKKMSLLRKFDEDAVSEIDDEDEDEGGTHESDDSVKYPTLFMHLTSM